MDCDEEYIGESSGTLILYMTTVTSVVITQQF